ncbi:MAG: cupin domain-containing protein [Holophagae bacterium]|jgi:quercetin dioxygenase-like cupin family protein
MNTLPQPNEGVPVDRASALSDLAAVAEGAIVSRVLARTKGGSVTLFAFDRDQQLSEHTAPFDALVQVVDGELELTIGGTAVPVGAGEVVVMPADVPHAVLAVQASRMVLTMLRGTTED